MKKLLEVGDVVYIENSGDIARKALEKEIEQMRKPRVDKDWYYINQTNNNGFHIRRYKGRCYWFNDSEKAIDADDIKNWKEISTALFNELENHYWDEVNK